MEALDREMLEMAGEQISSRPTRRARGLEAQGDEYDTAATPQTPPIGSPMALQRRRRILRPSERLARMRRATESGGSVADAMEETYTSLTRPPPPIEPSVVAVQEYTDEAQFHRETRWRATKRRKLDDGTHEDEAKTFSYGHNGQVVAGPLRLEIISCDGGAYSEPHIGSSWPPNVLQDDVSVYCTKSNRCNMLLKHVGGMPFSLTGLVVKAPRNGYDAPIQEGMVFASMDEDRMLERTAPYEIRYSPKKPREHSRREHSHISFGPSREYMNSVRSPLRSIDRSSYLRDPYPPHDIQETETSQLDASLVSEFEVSTTYGNHSDNEGSMRRSPLVQRPARMRRSSASYYNDRDHQYVPPVGLSDYYRPTYHDTDNEDDSQDSTSSAHESNPDLSRHLSGRTYPDPVHALSTRQRRLLRARQIEHANDVQNQREIQNDFTQTHRQLEAGEPEYSSRRVRLRLGRPGRIEVRPESRRQDTPDMPIPSEEQDDVYEPPSNETTDAAKSAEPEILKPHARFFIRRDKSSVTINFDPPV